MTIRFDPAAPYDVDEADVAFARPEGKDLLARIYRPRGVRRPRPCRARRRARRRVDPARPDGGRPSTAGRSPRAGSSSSPSTSGRARTTSIPPRAPTSPPACATCGRTRDGSASTPRAHRPHRQLERRAPRAPRRRQARRSRARGHADRAARTARSTPRPATTRSPSPSRSILSPIRSRATDTCSARKHEPVDPAGFDAKRLIASHHGYFADEAAMAAASVTRIVSAGRRAPSRRSWVAQPELDDNVPAAITEAFVRAYAEARRSHRARALPRRAPRLHRSARARTPTSASRSCATSSAASSPAAEKGPSAGRGAPSAARSTYREYASRAAFGRRLAAGPFSATGAVSHH